VHDHLLIKDSDKYLYGSPEERYEGSPYLNDSYVLGYVHSTVQKFSGVLMRYNIAEDVMEFQENGVKYALAPDPRVVKVEMGSQTFVVESLTGKSHFGFLELIEKGPANLLTKRVITYRKKIMISDIPAKYIPAPERYYLKIGRSEPLKVSNIKDIIASLPSHKQQLEEYAKKENLSPKERDSLIKLVHYYNTLSVSQN
jgi:hypothetical protein